MRFFRRGFADLQKNIVTPREIASRICASQLLLTRWAIEGSRTDQTMEAYETLQQTVQLKGLQHMTEMEKKWMDMPLGQWDPQMLFDLSFKWESLGILLWSLKIIDKVPYPSEMFPRQVLYQSTSLIPAFPETYDTFVEYFESGPGSDPEHFVSQSELSFLVDQTEAWFWRSKAQQVLELKHSLQEDTPQTKEAKKYQNSS
ncbi:hypothetical protein EDD86DRAFT_203970 [Gorgonomyces haynaldii]|nr:hypothetical protein EDD86DRAFT_203970 [Gorgonomyces haynaldii]